MPMLLLLLLEMLSGVGFASFAIGLFHTVLAVIRFPERLKKSVVSGWIGFALVAILTLFLRSNGVEMSDGFRPLFWGVFLLTAVLAHLYIIRKATSN